jgi:DNA polymerase V
MSPETKALGFTMGLPYYQQKDNLAQAGVAVFSSNYSLYGDISRRVMSSLESLVPEICQYSIDEAFIPLSESLAQDCEKIGWQFYNRVRSWVGMPVRVGLGPTRTIAKLANHWAKKKGRVYRLSPGTPEFEEILVQTAVKDVWGIGSRLSQKLQKMGIMTAADLRSMDLAAAKKLLTAKGVKTVQELNGQEAIYDDLYAEPFKSLVSSRSFGTKVVSFEPLMESLAFHCETVGTKLRLAELLTPYLSVFIGTGHYIDNPFQTGATVRLPAPTSYTPHLIQAARNALEHCYRTGFEYARAGVMAFELCADAPEDSLWPAEPDLSKANLMGVMDQINNLYGRGTIKFSAQGSPAAKWRMRRNKLSGISTTDWSELPLVKV